MKKIYTLLTMLSLASASFAQSFDVKVGDRVIEKVQTVQFAYETCPVNWIVPNIIGTYQFDPEIKIVADAEQQITVKTWDFEGDGFLQNCAFGQCVPVTAINTPVSATGTVKAGENDAAIHINYGSKAPEADLERSFWVSISNGTKTVEFVVQYITGMYALDIKNVQNDANAPVYTLSGVKVAGDAQKGKVYIKNGKKYIK